MAVSDKVKERLKADGVWKSFCSRREELKASGDLPRDAQRKALDEVGRSDGEVPAVAPASAASPENQQAVACSTVEM